MTVLPFADTIDALQIKGKHLRAALEHSVTSLAPCVTTDLFGGFLQVSGNSPYRLTFLLLFLGVVIFCCCFFVGVVCNACLHQLGVPASSPSRGGDVRVCVLDI